MASSSFILLNQKSMWQQQQKDTVIVKLSLLMAIATSSIVANCLISSPIQAESKNRTLDFTLPEKVETGTVIKIDGSRNSELVNQTLKKDFEQQFTGTKVEISTNDNQESIKAVLDGKRDLASLGRELTAEEKSEGLKQVLVHREKIAIIVGINNPFYGSLTTEKFAKIFQGEITDWSELGNTQGKIRFIDRPSNSDIRNSFSQYPAFKSGQLLTGVNAVQIPEDNTINIIKELGKDGISYALANQISKLPDVRVLKVQDHLPNNSEYPFYQSFVYVYKENPSPKVRDFLGFILAKPGKDSIKAAKEAEAVAVAVRSIQTVSRPIANASTGDSAVSEGPLTMPTTLVTPQPGGEIQLVNFFNNPSMITKNTRFLLLLPLFVIAGLSSFLPLLWRRKKRLSKEVQSFSNSETDSIPDKIITLPDSGVFASIINNNGNSNGNSTNHYQKNNPQEITAISNIAVIDVPQKNSPRNQITELSELSEIDLDDELVWNTEDPVIVVNSYFPQIPNIHQYPINVNINTDEFTDTSLDLVEPPATRPHAITSLSELLGIAPTPVKSEDLNAMLKPVKNPPQNQDLSSNLPSELGEALNAITSPITAKTVATEEEISPIPLYPLDINEPVATESDVETLVTEEEISPIPLYPLDINEAIATELDVETVVTEEEISLTPLYPTDINEAIATELDVEIETGTNIYPVNVTGNTRIILTPRTPKWAWLSWYISNDHQQILHNQGFSILAVRLYDVTNLDLSYQRPRFLQQYECETATSNRYVPIPSGERDYMTEIGYVNHDNQWLCLARSGIVRIFSRPTTNFWVIVDTELVLHGATEEGANISINGQKVKVNPDGTFKLTVPFVDNLVDYQITATSANIEHTKTIDKRFFQEEYEG
ncbi:MAG: substrate-binding domain-containing protein [Aphanizomenon sp.]|jgi:phosphate transport system substrate-binding protein